MSTAVMDRRAVSVPAGDTITGRVVATTPKEIRVILATDRLQRDGISLDMDGVTFRRGVRELPLIVAHDLKTVPIGRVRDIRVEQRDGYRCLTGALVFGASQRAKEIEHDIRLGIITDVSIGFDIPDKSARDWRTGKVRRWLCTEASLVPVGLDENTVVYQRSHYPSKGVTMPHPAARTREYRTRPYGADSYDDRPSRRTPLTGLERAALRSLLDGGPVYQRAVIDQYERAVRDRAIAEGRPDPATVVPWFPAISNATGYGSRLPDPTPMHMDRSMIHIVRGMPLPDANW